MRKLRTLGWSLLLAAALPASVEAVVHTVDGRFVCDGTAGDYFNAKYGELQAHPLVLEIRDGRLVSAECDHAGLRQDFWDYTHTDANSDRVGELAFGTNLGLREMIGILLQDEKVPASTSPSVTLTAARRTPTGSPARTSTSSPATAMCG